MMVLSFRKNKTDILIYDIDLQFESLDNVAKIEVMFVYRAFTHSGWHHADFRKTLVSTVSRLFKIQSTSWNMRAYESVAIMNAEIRTAV